MINLILRLVIGFILALICFGVTLNYLHVPPDKYLPAPILYSNATAKGVGVVTKAEDLGYGNHWWSGTGDEYYVDYAFQPTKTIQEPNGGVKKFWLPQWYTGSVRVDQTTYDNWNDMIQKEPKPPIQVVYDPLNPAINGVQGSQGKYSRYAGWFGIWLLYFGGLLAVAIIFEEILKRWMPSE